MGGAQIGFKPPLNCSVSSFQLALQRFGVLPEKLVFLDDHEANVHAAQALGWNVLQFRDAQQAEGGTGLVFHFIVVIFIRLWIS